MIFADGLAMVVCGATALFVALRAELLRSRFKSPFQVNRGVRLMLDLVAIAFVACAIEIAHGGHVRLAELALYVACCAASCVILAGNVIHGWRDTVHVRAAETREADVTAVKAAVAEVAPAAVAQAVAETVPAAVQEGLPDYLKRVAVYPEPPPPDDPAKH